MQTNKRRVANPYGGKTYDKGEQRIKRPTGGASVRRTGPTHSTERKGSTRSTER